MNIIFKKFDYYPISIEHGVYNIENDNNVLQNTITRCRTQCCSLAQLSLSDTHTLEEIEGVIKLLKEESNDNSISRYHRQGGERAVFVIVTEKENGLRENLIKLNFNKVSEFPRRACYKDDSMLEMWLLSW